MKRILFILLISLVLFVSCGGNEPSPDTGNTGGDTSADTGDTVDTGDSGDTLDTGNTSDSANTGNTSDTGDTVDTGDSANTGNTSAIDPDADDDGDGIKNGVEAPNGIPLDTDEDGTPDYKDTDSDGDGIPDSVEGVTDTDGDGTPNYRDTDSDNDNIPDEIEAGEDPTDPADFDEDGIPNYLDDDSDNDGIRDLFDGITDPDKDGFGAYLDTDADGDGISDHDENGDNEPPLDSDDDKVPDFLDSDSDNDGLSDARELALGTNAKLADTDGDGIDDNTEVAFGSDPTDAGSGIPEDTFYVVLPYHLTDTVVKSLEFTLAISKVDVFFLMDISGSMQDEIDNLKAGIINTILPGVNAKVDDVAMGLASFGNDSIYSVKQTLTKDTAALTAAISGLNASGGDEYHADVLYFAAGGTGTVDCNCRWGGFLDLEWICDTCPIQPAGWRDGALPIFIMITDEEDGFTTSDHSLTEAINSMNTINAKFIGVDSSGVAMDEYATVSNGTKSLDSASQPFNFQIPGDGSGLSTSIVDAVVDLAGELQIAVLATAPKHIDNLFGIADTTTFLESIIPDATSAVAPTIVVGNTFEHVKPGLTLIFDVTFKNDFYENETTESQLIQAKIDVVGAGTVLDTRDVYILIPGKDVGSGGS